jgi:23S rRNA pseudouridine955/2504/2580 synthase
LKLPAILYEDELCLILNKPAGLAVQGGAGVAVSLDSILAENRSPRPLLVHRLDRDTSGVILTAKTKEAAARFSRLLADTRSAGSLESGPANSGIVKRYLAVCAGTPARPEGVIRLDLEIKGSVKRSETRYKLLSSVPACAESPAFSLLELELGTGRMHQIRRHLALTGTPIPGDDKYGDFRLNKQLHKTLGLKRLLLHAVRLVIPPARLDISAPLPDYFSAFLEQTGLRNESPIPFNW